MLAWDTRQRCDFLIVRWFTDLSSWFMVNQFSGHEHDIPDIDVICESQFRLPRYQRGSWPINMFVES